MTNFDGLEQDDLGMPTEGRAITATLFVSPNGDDSDGSTWAKAYNTIQSALDAASTDADECTTILLSPHATFYDIDTTGDPTWAGNYIIKGTHRRWTAIKNTHASATSIFKFSGKVALKDLAISQTAAVDGVIFTNSGYRVDQCGFNSEVCTGAVTSIHIDGATLSKGGKIRDTEIQGHVTYTTGILMNKASINQVTNSNIHGCLNGIQVTDATSYENEFEGLDVSDCAIGLNLDAGEEQHFHDVVFSSNTLNVDDEVGGHTWTDIQGEFPIMVEPADLAGVTVDSGAATWGADTEIRAAATATKPFKVIAYTVAPSDDETMIVRFSADSGSTYFTQSVFASKKDKASGGGDATDFIFNVGTRISASLYGSGITRDVAVWLEIQEI